MSDEALAAETKRVAEIERRSMADLLLLLIEVERRRLHLSLGHSSLFVYCMRVLHFSEQAAYSRITAARAARRFPQLITHLANGALTLSSIGLLAPHLTEETVKPLLDAARFKSTRDVERLVACLHPQPDIPATVRALPQPSMGPLPIEVATPTAGEAPTEAPSPVPSMQPSSRTVVAPIAPRRYLLRVTLDESAHDKLQQLRALLRHSVPNGDVAVRGRRSDERGECAAQVPSAQRL